MTVSLDSPSHIIPSPQDPKCLSCITHYGTSSYATPDFMPEDITPTSEEKQESVLEGEKAGQSHDQTREGPHLFH